MPEAGTPEAGARLADLTTLRLGGPARGVVDAGTEAELSTRSVAPTAPAPALLVLAGGSNLVVADEGFAGHGGPRSRTRGVEARRRRGGVVRSTVAAGEPWDALVARCVADGLAGVEACPASPARSARRRSRTSAPTARRSPRRSRACACSTARRDEQRDARGGRVRLRLPDQPRSSASPAGYVVLAVTFALRRGERSARRSATPSSARALGVEVGDARAAGRRPRRGARAARAARAWCSTPPTPTPGAPARSSPTRCSVRRAAARPAAARTRRRLPAAGRRRQDHRRVADRARRLRPRLRRAGRAGCALSGKHTLALTNRGGARTARPARARPRDARRGRGGVRRSPRPGAGARRLHARLTTTGPGLESSRKDDPPTLLLRYVRAGRWHGPSARSSHE